MTFPLPLSYNIITSEFTTEYASVLNFVILITRLYKGLPHTLYEEYRKIRDNLKGEIKEQKSENIIEDPTKWMSLMH